MSALALANVGMFIFLACIGVGFLIFVASFFQSRKSKHYRKEMMDMYVVAKTKQLAAKEGLDLIKETESFKKWLKKQKLDDSDRSFELDDVIEESLKEKIAEPIEQNKPLR